MTPRPGGGPQAREQFLAGVSVGASSTSQVSWGLQLALERLLRGGQDAECSMDVRERKGYGTGPADVPRERPQHLLLDWKPNFGTWKLLN